MLLWVVACFFGTLGASLQDLPSDVSFATADGSSIDFCKNINPKPVEQDLELAYQWCTADTIIGRSLPKDVQSFRGRVQWSSIAVDDVLRVFAQPQLWLTIGLGTIALMFLTGFAKATGTLRAGLAASITVIFFGLLLFPSVFTRLLPPDMRSELVSAWQWVIAFYFGSEAAVQAVKVWKPAASGVGGDTGAGRAPKVTTTTVHVEPN